MSRWPSWASTSPATGSGSCMASPSAACRSSSSTPSGSSAGPRRWCSLCDSRGPAPRTPDSALGLATAGPAPLPAQRSNRTQRKTAQNVRQSVPADECATGPPGRLAAPGAGDRARRVTGRGPAPAWAPQLQEPCPGRAWTTTQSLYTRNPRLTSPDLEAAALGPVLAQGRAAGPPGRRSWLPTRRCGRSSRGIAAARKGPGKVREGFAKAAAATMSSSTASGQRRSHDIPERRDLSRRSRGLQPEGLRCDDQAIRRQHQLDRSRAGPDVQHAPGVQGRVPARVGRGVLRISGSPGPATSRRARR